MTIRSTLKSGVSPFAHLGRSAKAADDDDTKKKDAAKKAKAEDDDEPKDDDKKKEDAKGKKAKAADDDDDDGDKPKDDGEKDDDDDMKSKGKKAKKAKAEGDDDDMEDEEQDKDARAARARERSRIKAIMLSEPGKANPVAAAHLATGTAMPRGQAIEMLAAMQAGQPSASAEPRRDDLRSRMSEVPNPALGSDAPRSAPNLAAQIVAADKKRRGEA